MSGYTDCACRDCFDVAIGDGRGGRPSLCGDCSVASCSRNGDAECEREVAYGVDGYDGEREPPHQSGCVCLDCNSDNSDRAWDEHMRTSDTPQDSDD